MVVKIFLDPGHGGRDPGAVANGIREKDISLDIGIRIRDILANEYEGVAVKMSRSKDTTLSLQSRTNAANSWAADLFLSIHVNAGGGTGFESFVHPQIPHRTFQMQVAIHDEILKQIRGVRDRGRKRQNFHVLRETNKSAVLTENLFIDTKSDADKLKDSSFIEKLARGHANGIEKAFNLKRRVTQASPPKSSTGELYRVQVGAFSNRANAESLAKELEQKGYQTLITKN